MIRQTFGEFGNQGSTHEKRELFTKDRFTGVALLTIRERGQVLADKSLSKLGDFSVSNMGNEVALSTYP